MEVAFTNVEDGASYYANVAYISESGYLIGNEYSAFFSVKFSQPSLSTITSVKNAYNNTINETKAKINVHLTNAGATDYNDMVFVRIYKYRNDGSGWGDLAGIVSKMASVPASGSADVELEFDSAEDGACYFTNTLHVSNGEETMNDNRIETEFGVDLSTVLTTKGDAKGDGTINAADIVQIVNTIMSK